MMSIDEAIVILDNSNIVYSQLLMEPYQTLKAAVLAQQTTNKQSTPCLCNVGVEYIPQLVRVCSNCGQPK